NQYLKRELRKGHDEKSIIGSSEEMLRVFKMVEKVADSEATIMIQGESGTGKELIAREIHYRSRRATGPFGSINCGEIARDEREVAEGRFRADLFYRLNVIPIKLPPLRLRRDDIPLMVDHFLKRYIANGGSPKTVNKEALELLMKYDWPGNVRELENVLERAT